MPKKQKEQKKGKPSKMTSTSRKKSDKKQTKTPSPSSKGVNKKGKRSKSAPPSSAKRMKPSGDAAAAAPSLPEIVALPSNGIFTCTDTDEHTKHMYFSQLRMPIPTHLYKTVLRNYIKKRDDDSEIEVGAPTWTVSVGDTVLVIVKDPNLHTPDRRYRAKKAAPWYPFEDSYGPCQILAIHREMSTTAKDHDYKIDVRWFHRKTEVQGETPVNARDFKEEHVMEWENMPSQEVAEIVETGAGAIGKDLFPSMLVGWCSLVDYASKLDGDVVHQIISKSANIKSIQLGRDGVPLIKYICKSFLSDDKAMSHILRHTGKCHAEDMYTQEFVSVEKLLCEMIEEGYDVLPTRRLVRGLRCLGMDEMHTLNLLKTCLTPSSHAGMDFKDEEFGNVELDEDAEELVDDASIKSSDDDVEVMEHDGQSNDKTTKLVKIAATNEVESEVESNSDLEVEDESMWASEKPFHVDISAKKAFYMSMNVTPPSHLYAIENTANGEEEWQVSVGDVVAIQVDVGSVRRRQSKRMSSELLNHPYSVCWWCAEVLTIYRDLDSTNEAKLLKKTSKDVAEGTASKEYSQFQLELRWLYRMEDIPGFAHSKSEAEDSLVELFETDDVDVFPANTLLGPVTVHSEAAPSTPLASFHQGMPLVHFLCHRFWTLHRKTLMPIGSAETRFQRGMMYSKFLGRGSAIRASFEQATGNTDTSVGLNITSSDWKARFHDTISKLSLAEASAVESGVEVIGREAQQTQIKSFLHSAVKGVNMKDMTDVRNSNVFALFIGGPPGKFKSNNPCALHACKCVLANIQWFRNGKNSVCDLNHLPATQRTSCRKYT